MESVCGSAKEAAEMSDINTREQQERECTNCLERSVNVKHQHNLNEFHLKNTNNNNNNDLFHSKNRISLESINNNCNNDKEETMLITAIDSTPSKTVTSASASTSTSTSISILIPSCDPADDLALKIVEEGKEENGVLESADNESLLNVNKADASLRQEIISTLPALSSTLRKCDDINSKDDDGIQLPNRNQTEIELSNKKSDEGVTKALQDESNCDEIHKELAKDDNVEHMPVLAAASLQQPSQFCMFANMHLQAEEMKQNDVELNDGSIGGNYNVWMDEETHAIDFAEMITADKDDMNLDIFGNTQQISNNIIVNTAMSMEAEKKECWNDKDNKGDMKIICQESISDKSQIHWLPLELAETREESYQSSTSSDDDNDNDSLLSPFSSTSLSSTSTNSSSGTSIYHSCFEEHNNYNNNNRSSNVLNQNPVTGVCKRIEETDNNSNSGGNVYSYNLATPTNSSESSSAVSNHSNPSIGVNLRVTGQCNQGGRKYMEDYFAVAYQQSENSKDLEYAFFGIYDGHGGAEAATFAKEHLMMSIINQKEFWSDSDQDVLRAIREGYIATHYAMWREQGK